MSKKRTSPKYQSILQVLLLIAIIVAVNVLSSNVYQRLDLTKEKRFTLTDATKDVLNNLDETVYVTVFLEGEFPAGFRRLRKNTLEMLNEFRAYSGGDLDFRFENPLESTQVQERQAIVQQLVNRGLEPRRLVENSEGFSEKVIFPAAIVAYKGRELPVNLLQQQLSKGAEQTLNESISLIEYNLANAIQKLQRPSKPMLAFLEGHGELPKENLTDIMATLSTYYVVERIDLTQNLYIPAKYDAIIIAKPTQKFEESNKYKIDQYLMNGGSALWLLENMAANLDSLRKGSFIALDQGLNMEDMLFKYGVRVNFDLVQDVQCTKIPVVVGQDKFGNAQETSLLRWIYSPVITNVNNEHPVTKNLDAVLAQFICSLDTIQTKKAKIKKTVLLQSSPYSKKAVAPIKVDVNRDTKRPDLEQFKGGPIPIAVALEGEFISAFKNRLAFDTKQMVDTIPELKNRDISSPTKMVVVGDGDFIKNEIDPKTGQILPLGLYKFTKETFANKDFILNAIEWLTDEKGVIAARSKDVKLRLLDKERIKVEKTKWQILNIALPLLLVLLLALVYAFVRRKRFG